MPINYRKTMPEDDGTNIVAAFEAWATAQNLDLSPPPEGVPGRYGDARTAEAYRVWLAASNRVDPAEA